MSTFKPGQLAFRHPGFKPVCIATGLSSPTHCPGGLGGQEKQRILLVDGRQDTPHEVVQQFFSARNFTGVTIFGGKAAVSEDIEDWFSTTMGSDLGM